MSEKMNETTNKTILENKDVKNWLLEFKTENTTKLFSLMIKRFFTWYAENHHETIENFVNLSVKEMKHLVLIYQSDLLKKGESANTIRAAITSVKSFAAYLDKPLNLRGKIVKIEPDVDSHVFRNGDLTAMFNVGNTKDKAILSTMCSLGWERESIVGLEREFIERHLAIAKSEGKRFVFFDAKRGKTKALRLGVLNPLAIEWLEKWLQTTESKKTDKLFDMTGEGLCLLVKRLARESRILTTGRIHSHLIRKWVMSQLSRSGFNEWETKFTVGKAIPLSDSTYLTTIKDAIMEKYPKVYDEFLNINPAIVKVEVKTEDFQQLKVKLDRKDNEIEDMKTRIDELSILVRDLSKQKAKRERSKENE